MKVFWNDTEKTILIREFSSEWTWEDYDEAVLKARHMLMEVSHSVFLIIDAREVRSIPIGALSHFNEANRNLPSHLVMRVMVSNNSVLMRLYAMLQRIAPDNFSTFYWVSSMEEAYKKIEEYQQRR